MTTVSSFSSKGVTRDRTARPLGIGLVGAGMVGQLAHLANLVGTDGCRVVGIAELRPELGGRAAELFGVPRVYESHRELLDDPEIDAAVVVTRRNATGPIVLDLLQAGKHVLSEKPMAHTVEQAERLVDAATRSAVVYAVGYMKRHDPGALRAKAMLDRLASSRELGRILLVRSYCYGGETGHDRTGFVMTDEARPDGLDLWPIAPDWLPEPLHADYAWFLNVFVHDLNILRFLFDATPTVQGVDFARRNGRLVTFRFAEFPAVLEMCEAVDGAWCEGVEVIFERGRLELTFPPPLRRNAVARVSLHKGECDTRETDQPVEERWAFARQAESFVAAAGGGAPSPASGADSLEDLKLAEEIWRLHLSQVGSA